MSSTIALEHSLRLFSYIQVSVTIAVLYDHALTFGREVKYIWRKSPSMVTVLYLSARYVGDAVVIIGAYLCLTEIVSINVACLTMHDNHINFFPNSCFRLFQVRAWGVLIYSWLTQCIMQLRIYAMYSRSRRILVLLLSAFVCEVLAVVLVIWRTIGPTSNLVVDDEPYPGQHTCSFSGVDKNFTYLLIPIFCFEAIIFALAINISLRNMRNTRSVRGAGATTLRVDSFMDILVRDSVLYFSINLAVCVIVMGTWQNITAIRANITIPFIMLVEIVLGTRMVINFKEHCFRRLSMEPIMMGGGTESIRFATMGRDATRLNVIHVSQSMKEDEEIRPMKDEDCAEIIAFEELSISGYTPNLTAIDVGP